MPDERVIRLFDRQDRGPDPGDHGGDPREVVTRLFVALALSIAACFSYVRLLDLTFDYSPDPSHAQSIALMFLLAANGLAAITSMVLLPFFEIRAFDNRAVRRGVAFVIGLVVAYLLIVGLFLIWISYAFPYL